MAFWGVEVKPGRPHSHQFNNTQRRRLHISQATLGVGTALDKSSVQCNVGDKAPSLLCCLIPNKYESCHLALEFEEEDDDVIFSVLGPRSVHLTGFYLDKPFTNGDDTDSYGEDIGESDSDSDSDPCNDHDDEEDEYEDDFINDGDIELVPDSPIPKSRVAIVEILDDEKPAKVNDNRKRLEKKFQVSDSDGDAQKDIAKNDARIITVESDDDKEGLPISSVITTKHQESDSAGYDQKQNFDKGGTNSFDLDNKNEDNKSLASVLNTKDGSIQEKSDKKEFMENKKNEAQDGGDQVTSIERKIEDIEGCEIERRTEQPTIAPLQSLEVGHGTDEPPKKTRRKRTKDKQTGGIRDDMGAGCVDSEEKPKKKRKKKRLIERQCGGVENDSKVGAQEEKNFVAEARIDGTSNNELVKDQPIENLSNYKAFVPSSHENDFKTKEEEKHAKERQTTEVGNDGKIDDVQEENIQVKDAVNNDFNQEVHVKDNVIDNISSDKGAGCVGHEGQKSKKRRKKRVKESQYVGAENDSKIYVQEEENCKVEARIDDISKNDPVNVD